jgi:membrane-bound metal-dependent hydrolase YbcI (DUF457 family)
MDNLTHTLFALTLARTRLGRLGPGTTAALVLASNAPDVDIVAALGGTANYLAWHRGPTHGLLGVGGLGVVTAALVWGGRKIMRHTRDPAAPDRRDAPFGTLVIVSMIGVLLHALMDLPTSYGTRLLSPFSWRWYAIDLLPIIDIYLLAALASGLVLGRRSAEAGRKWAAIVLVLMAVNYAGRAIAHHEAFNLTERLVRRWQPPACDSPARSVALVDAWPRATGHNSSCLVEAAAIPSFLSPLQWRLIAQFPDEYHIYEIDLRDRSLRLDPNAIMPDSPLWDLLPKPVALLPNQWTPVVFEAAGTRTAQIFLGFSRFPLVRDFRNASGVATVRFTDLRFNTGFEEDSPLPAGRSAFFTVTVQIGPDHQIIRERLGE